MGRDYSPAEALEMQKSVRTWGYFHDVLDSIPRDEPASRAMGYDVARILGRGVVGLLVIVGLARVLHGQDKINTENRTYIQSPVNK